MRSSPRPVDDAHRISAKDFGANGSQPAPVGEALVKMRAQLLEWRQAEVERGLTLLRTWIGHALEPQQPKEGLEPSGNSRVLWLDGNQ